MAYLVAHRDYTRNYHIYDKEHKVRHKNFLDSLGNKLEQVGKVMGVAKGIYDVGKGYIR
jgi:hypothetical protein